MRGILTVLMTLVITLSVKAQNSFTDQYQSFKYKHDPDGAFELLKGSERQMFSSNDMSLINAYITVSKSYLQDFPPCSKEAFKAPDNDCIEIGVRNTMIKMGFVPHALSARAEIKFKRQDYYGAIKDWKEAISCYPENDEVFDGKSYYFNIGLCYWNLKQSQEACLNMSKAGELGNAKAYQFIKEECNK